MGKMKTIEKVLGGLKCCEKLLCDSCPFDGDENCKSTILVEARRAIENIIFDNELRGDAVTELLKSLDAVRDENRALRTELKVNLGNQYWMNVCKMNARQETKGMEKYGEPLEENTTLTTVQRIEHLQEELIDGLKYCEHLKATCNDGITANDYQRAAMRTDNKDQTEEERMLDALFGLCGEAGEVMDAYKKHRFQGHESYKDEMIIEASDCLWYLAKLADVLGVTLGEVMERNIEKLKKRFPEGFSKDRSINRKE